MVLVEERRKREGELGVPKWGRSRAMKVDISCGTKERVRDNEAHYDSLYQYLHLPPQNFFSSTSSVWFLACDYQITHMHRRWNAHHHHFFLLLTSSSAST